MESFMFIIIILVAIVISNLAFQFLPNISVPIIQMALGVFIFYMPKMEVPVLEPELFFVLFIAPLLFNEGKNVDKESMWQLRAPILSLALGLVFLTVLVVGFCVKWLVPSMPLAAAFALAAALAPTDAVAIISLKEKIKMPHSILHILEGEALINDASGIVSFQFAIAAVITGTFSIINASASFIVIALGGVFLGLALTLLKYIFVRWIRILGMENAVLHMLLEILTPFLIFLVCEEVGVSGILAVVASGVAHSFNAKRLNPEIARLNMLSVNTWSVFSFALNGLIFVLLGTQLPALIETVWVDTHTNTIKAILLSILISFILNGIRFLWALITINPKTLEIECNHMPRIKAALVISLSGVKGAVTLATALSVPLFLSDFTTFPERDLILFLAVGVIICTLLCANFLLPIILKSQDDEVVDDSEVRRKILRDVVKELKSQANETNFIFIERIIFEYDFRINQIQQKETEDDFELKLKLFVWKKENVINLIESGAIEQELGYHFISMLYNGMIRDVTDHRNRAKLFSELKEIKKKLNKNVFYKIRIAKEFRTRQNMRVMQVSNSTYVLEKLLEEQKLKKYNSEQLQKLINEFEWRIKIYSDNDDNDKAVNYTKEERDKVFISVASLGFQLERDFIHQAFENDFISRERAKELRQNVDMMEFSISG